MSLPLPTLGPATTWGAAERAAAGTREGVFFADGGGVFDVREVDGQVIVTGRNTRVTYGAPHLGIRTATRLEQTGSTVRRQQTGRAYTVRGVRGVLHLDTGEGLESIPGVIAVPE